MQQKVLWQLLAAKAYKHENENTILLDKNVTVIQDAAHIESCQVDGLNPSETPFVDDTSENASWIVTFNKNPDLIVPLCSMAQSCIIQKGKTLPASFIATLCQALRFLKE